MKVLKEAQQILKDNIKSEILSVVLKAVNKVAELHKIHEEAISTKCEQKDFKNVGGIDFNEWAHDQLEAVGELYHELKSRWHDLHWDQKGFNVY